MCIAIYKPIGATLPRERADAAYRANPDGCGFMWAQDGKIQIVKGCFDFAEFWQIYIHSTTRTDPAAFIFHFRAASCSATTAQTCHPFMVDDDLAFVHNGNLFHFLPYFSDGFRDGLSDTMRFNCEVLQRLPKGFLGDPYIRTALEDYCKDNMSKMIFLDSQGKVDIVNQQAGMWQNGCWYSNGGIENYTGYGFSGAYYYEPGDIRHKGGIITPMVFPAERREAYGQCLVCHGFFRREYLEGEKCQACRTLETLKQYTR